MDTTLTAQPGSRSLPGPYAVSRPRAPRRRGVVPRVARAVVVLLLVALVPVLGAVVLARALGYVPLVVEAGSMGDAYPVGSLAFSRPSDARDVEVGDVVVTRATGDTLVLHRVVSKEEIRGRVVVRTKGDASPSRDPGRVVLRGRVPVATGRIPLLGYVVDLISTPVGWALLIVLPAAVLTAGLVVRIWSEPPAAAGGRARSDAIA